MNRLFSAKYLVFVILGLLLITVPIIFRDPYYLHFLIMSMIYGITAMGWILTNRTGEFSLGQAGFLAIGSYTSAILTMKLGLSFWIALPVAGIVAMVIGAMIGTVVLRLRGLYFGLVSFGFAEVIRLVINNTSFLGGAVGIFDIPAPDSIRLPGLGALEFIGRVPSYYLCLFLFLVSGCVFWRLDVSRPGKIYRAIAENARLAESLGVYEMKYKVQAFAIACFFTGVAGSFYAHYLNMLTPAMFNVEQSIWIFLCAILGGVRSIVFGPLLGALVMTVVSNALRSYGSFEPMVLGIVLMVICLYFPGGLVSIGTQITQRLAQRKFDMGEEAKAT